MKKIDSYFLEMLRMAIRSLGSILMLIFGSGSTPNSVITKKASHFCKAFVENTGVEPVTF
ncbi:hypothetical protein [Algoriphagus sediminis]|uniref:Uncharacterized protein n=1 Tax=Algoriphagus sediminis TaxID=3057113 RepID=A0ABT7YFF7_9BACT|nr:hypothetical protein [Algoriphagus sediminis]MDN3205065.1 hypothetical protein [Algoriphagus sediminis]